MLPFLSPRMQPCIRRYCIEIYDMEHSINEDRYNTIGMVNDILFVVYTERKENIRLISARLATKTERSIYYDTDSYFG